MDSCVKSEEMTMKKYNSLVIRQSRGVCPGSGHGDRISDYTEIRFSFNAIGMKSNGPELEILILNLFPSHYRLLQ
jgi:hypothetical protein